MALPGTPASKLASGNSRLKLLLYGDWKVGKTTACCQFPDSFFIDGEQGAEHEQYVELLKAANGHYYATSEFDDVVSAVKSLLSERHDRKTLVIDPITMIYADLIDTGEQVKGDEWGKHIGYADQHMKRLFLLLARLDTNLIVTSHAKPEYKKVGNTREDTGKLTPDAWKKLPYLFDLVIELQRKGDHRIAEIRGTRLKEFTDGEKFEWSYDEFKRRLGAGALERLAEQVELASAEQIKEVRRLLVEAGISDEDEAKILRKARAAKWEDVPSEQAAAAIGWLEKRADAQGGPA